MAIDKAECPRCFGNGRVVIEALEKFDYFIWDEAGLFTKRCPQCEGKGIVERVKNS